MEKQVDKELYFTFDYNSQARFISYWYQLTTIIKYKPKNVLEVGIGNKIVSDLLKKFNCEVTTVDIDKELKPDYVASIENLPFPNNSFDIVCAFEILEHLPFKKFENSLKEMKRVSRNKIIFSIPDVQPSIYFCFKVTAVPRIKFQLNLPNIIKRRHKFNGQHYWELNKEDTGFRKVKSIFNNLNLELIDHFRIKENPYHHFFILQKSEDENP